MKATLLMTASHIALNAALPFQIFNLMKGFKDLLAGIATEAEEKDGA